MKKFRFLITAGISLALIFGGLASCKKKTESPFPKEPIIKIGENSKLRKSLTATLDNDRASFATMLSFFTPDYSTETPDYPVESEQTKAAEKKSKKKRNLLLLFLALKSLANIKLNILPKKNHSLPILLVKNKQKRKIFRAFLLL